MSVHNGRFPTNHYHFTDTPAISITTWNRHFFVFPDQRGPPMLSTGEILTKKHLEIIQATTTVKMTQTRKQKRKPKKLPAKSLNVDCSGNKWTELDQVIQAVTFYPLVEGHLTFPKGHLTIPKSSQRLAREASYTCWDFQSGTPFLGRWSEGCLGHLKLICPYWQ